MAGSLKCAQTDIHDIKIVAKIHEIVDGNGLCMYVRAHPVKIPAASRFRDGELEGLNRLFTHSPFYEFGTNVHELAFGRSGTSDGGDAFVDQDGIQGLAGKAMDQARGAM